uniref:Uncharacterized protein n=1 Tax=Pseudomonas syringae pv. actinidiae TaxID=103796 RepID=A0A2P0QET7_PSESF|nr:hypothetical protein [Pseudomonas syringae pv. actinidiae]
MCDDLIVVEAAVWLVLSCATIRWVARWYRKQQVKEAANAADNGVGLRLV